MADDPDKAAIRFCNVSKSFSRKGDDKFVALNDVSFDVPRATITGIIGRSGAGKSTLLRMVNGLEAPSSGQIIVNGHDVGAADASELRRVRRSVGMIFQHFNLLSARTVRGNITMPLEIAGLPKHQITPRVDELIALVGLEEQRDSYPAQLSGGQKQRVGIARALATRPDVLLSDEATSALDPETTRQVLALLKRINRDLGLTILLITHEMGVVRDIATHVAVIEAGRIVEQGETYNVFARPAHPVTQSFLSGITGVALPHFVADRIHDDPAPGRDVVLKITFTGDSATEPLMARLSSDLGADVNILAGAVEEIGERPFGNLLVSMRLDPAQEAQALAFLERHGMITEVLGYVC